MTEVGRAYGGALYALAREEHMEDVLLEQLRGVAAILEENPAYMKLIGNRAMARAERLALLDAAFSGRVEPYLLNFMKILCENGGFARLFECRDAFVLAYNEDHGIAVATVVCAAPLCDAQQERLKAALEKKSGKRVELSVRVDPVVRGGMRVEMAGIRYDNTIASRMDRLRRTLLAQS